MKKIVLAVATLGVLAFGADYSAMSATELSAMRGTVPTEDRAAFQSAMQTKMQALSPEERSSLTQARTSNPGTGSMGGNAGAGSGAGGGNGKGGGRGGR